MKINFNDSTKKHINKLVPGDKFSYHGSQYTVVDLPFQNSGDVFVLDVETNKVSPIKNHLKLSYATEVHMINPQVKIINITDVKVDQAFSYNGSRYIRIKFDDNVPMSDQAKKDVYAFDPLEARVTRFGSANMKLTVELHSDVNMNITR